MAMISIKRFLHGNDRENAAMQVAALLVEKLGDCAVEGDTQELESFRGEMRGIHDAMTPDLSTENLLVLAGSAAQALEAYNRRITSTISKRGVEFQTIIRMLQDSLLKIGGENLQSVQSLNRIGEELDRGAGFQDLQSVKMHLSVCLSGLREEIERGKNASKTMVEGLRMQIEAFRGLAEKTADRKVNVAPGLPQQQDCIAAIQNAIEKGTRHYAVVMVVNRIQPINARFGRAAGDRILARFKECIEAQLGASDQLFRWIGPAVVVIMERPQSGDQVRTLVKRMFDTPIQENLELGARSVLIPISAAWSVITLTSAPEVEKQIEAFIASQGGHDYL
jgi:GGDEF domain-containing protein